MLEQESLIEHLQQEMETLHSTVSKKQELDALVREYMNT